MCLNSICYCLSDNSIIFGSVYSTECNIIWSKYSKGEHVPQGGKSCSPLYYN